MDNVEPMGKESRQKRERREGVNLGGRPRRDDSMDFKTMGLTPALWDFLKLWASDNDFKTVTNKKTGKEEIVWNRTPALLRLVEDMGRFLPNGPDAAPPKDERGRFLPRDGSTKSKRGRPKSELNAKIREQEAELARLTKLLAANKIPHGKEL